MDWLADCASISTNLRRISSLSALRRVRSINVRVPTPASTRRLTKYIIIVIVIGSFTCCVQGAMEQLPFEDVHIGFSRLDGEDMGLKVPVADHVLRFEHVGHGCHVGSV